METGYATIIYVFEVSRQSLVLVMVISLLKSAANAYGADVPEIPR